MALPLEKGKEHRLSAAVPFLSRKDKYLARKGGQMMEELTPLIANLGFPIVVSLYLLIRVERKLDELTACLKEANRNISKLL